jgi:hypothetical protein
LHWKGFPHLLWESLRSFCYIKPPQYDAVEYQKEGVRRCRVRMTIPQHPFRSQWQPIEVDVVGYRIVDTIEGAALEAMYLFLQPASKGSCRTAYRSIPYNRSQRS